MKAVILAGGLGTRLAEETEFRPKPMVEIGGRPILWHIMKTYYAHGIREFIICCGYKGYLIKEYFANYALHMSDVTFDTGTGQRVVHQNNAEDWRVTLVDTGEKTMTGGRLRRVRSYLGNEDFCFTYGDGLADIDIGKLVAFHREHGKLATVTTAQPPGRFGALDMQGQRITSFHEKPQGDGSWINAGFFVLSPKVIDHIAGDETVWQREPVEWLSAAGNLMRFMHRGFWRPMDTLRDRQFLEQAWASGQAPWKVWT